MRRRVVDPLISAVLLAAAIWLSVTKGGPITVVLAVFYAVLLVRQVKAAQAYPEVPTAKREPDEPLLAAP